MPAKAIAFKRKSQARTQNTRIHIFAEWLNNQPLLTQLTTVAVTVLFGMQVLRVLVPGVFWILSDRMGWSIIELGAIGLLIFLTALLAGPLSRFFPNRGLAMICAAGLGLTRLFMQLWWNEPLFNLSLAIIGTILFAIFLAAYLESTSIRGAPAMPHYFALGLLSGLTLDTAINGAFKTYDMVWQTKPVPVLITLLLVLIQLALIAAIMLTQKIAPSPTVRTHGVPIFKSLAWVAVGPFLFLELILFQNIPRVTTLTNWPLPLAFGMVLLAHLVGLATATWLLGKNWRILWPWALSGGIILTALLALGYQQPALTFVQLFLGQVLISALIIIVLMSITNYSKKIQTSGISIANGIGIALLIAFVFAYYAIYVTKLPYDNLLLEPIAGFMIAVCAVGATAYVRQEIKATLKLWTVPALSLILLILPLSMAFASRPPIPVNGEGFPVRIMTYNLHNGFNIKGKLELEAIAKTIEYNKPDIVALQEVSRGWVVNGRVDMLLWLSKRLQMPYVFGPTADPFWGNAILSRYPILAYSRHDLPPENLIIKRGFITALIDLGKDIKLKVITTHLHHLDNDTEIRQLQSRTIVNFITSMDKSRTVLLGDFNAEPNEPEMRMLQQASLMDTGARITSATANTFRSDNPNRRIDYIWISSDLQATDVRVPLSAASDHLPVVIELTQR